MPKQGKQIYLYLAGALDYWTEKLPSPMGG